MSDATRPDERPTWFRCRRCHHSGPRSEWVARHGILECGLCLPLAYVGLLEPCTTPAAKEADRA